MIAATNSQRDLLEAAALTQEVGLEQAGKRTPEAIRSNCCKSWRRRRDGRAGNAGGRHHCALPRRSARSASHPMFDGIAARLSRSNYLRLAGILRLANALAATAHSSDIQAQVSHADGCIAIPLMVLTLRLVQRASAWHGPSIYWKRPAACHQVGGLPSAMKGPECELQPAIRASKKGTGVRKLPAPAAELP